MPEPVVSDAVQVAAVGEPPKVIRELVGRVATGDERLSVAVMRSPAAWIERVQYETPGGAEHVAVCVPAFGPDIVRREE